MNTQWKNLDKLHLNKEQLIILQQTLNKILDTNLLNEPKSKNIDSSTTSDKEHSMKHDYACSRQNTYFNEVNVDVEATKKQYQYKENISSKLSSDINFESSNSKKNLSAQNSLKKENASVEKHIKKRNAKKQGNTGGKLIRFMEKLKIKDLNAKEYKILSEFSHYFNLAILFSKQTFIVSKNVVFFFGCLILMITILALKVLWFLVINLLRFMIIFFILALAWSSIKINHLWCVINNKFDIWSKMKKFFSASLNFTELLIGIDLRKFVKTKVADNEDAFTGVLPSTSKEAIQYLLKQKENRPFKTLCVSTTASGEMIRSNYRAIARLVHPDKCDDPSAAEAFKILDAAFKKIYDEDSRCKQSEKEEMERQHEELNRQFENSELKSFIDKLMNTIPCTSCGGQHRKTLQENRKHTQGRYCGECKDHHLASDGDVWAESNSFGVSWICYACFNNQIYELTEWAKCNRLHQSLQVNTHQVYCRLGSVNLKQQNRKKFRETESSDSLKAKHKKGRKNR
ncbi:uncharacterized protein LOC101236616 isoform X2 [Hydra vulgaris]|uniref:Uncharacterized protein LOC101236616 isoform X2 n=1 Tax=Hydra vulgaris TaxID=6087 RepID=A0ABM4C663_HYDVU